MPPTAQHQLRRPLDGFAVTVMPTLCLCWGLQPTAIKIAAQGMNPILQIGVRSLLAAILLAVVIGWRGARISFRDGTFWPGIATGLMFAAQFVCVAIGLMHTAASHMVVFMYTAPVFTALGLHWAVPGEQLRPMQMAGVCTAFAGVALAFSDGLGANSGNTLPGDTLAVLAGICWACTTVTIRRTVLSETSSDKTLLYHLTVASIVTLAISMSSPATRVVTLNLPVCLSLAFQVVIISFVTFLTWLWLLRRYLASRLAVFSFLTPLFGVAFGVLLLNERVDAKFALGAVLVVTGIILVNRRVATLSIEGE